MTSDLEEHHRPQKRCVEHDYRGQKLMENVANNQGDPIMSLEKNCRNLLGHLWYSHNRSRHLARTIFIPTREQGRRAHRGLGATNATTVRASDARNNTLAAWFTVDGGRVDRAVWLGVEGTRERQRVRKSLSHASVRTLTSNGCSTRRLLHPKSITLLQLCPSKRRKGRASQGG